MAKSPAYHWTINAALLLCRVAQGGYFFFSGIGKIRGQGSPLSNLRLFVESYQASWPDWVPDSLIRAYSYCLPVLELLLGTLLALGLMTRTVSLLMSFVILSIFLLAGIKAGGGPISPYIIMLSLALLIASTGPGRYSLDHQAWK